MEVVQRHTAGTRDNNDCEGEVEVEQQEEVAVEDASNE